jgi:hypothetical protein
MKHFEKLMLFKTKHYTIRYIITLDTRQLEITQIWRILYSLINQKVVMHSNDIHPYYWIADKYIKIHKPNRIYRILIYSVDYRSYMITFNNPFSCLRYPIQQQVYSPLQLPASLPSSNRHIPHRTP